MNVGFVGAVTEDLPALVNPAGMTGVTVLDVVDSVNSDAADLKAGGADIIVLLVHEGSPSTDCTSSSFTDDATVFGNIVQNTSADVDAIVSGHTHLAYNCRYTVPDWAGRDVTRRPVVSAGQYGTNLNQLVFNFDTTSGDLLEIEQELVGTAGVGYSADPDVQAIVDDAVDFANEIGDDVLGQMEGPFNRAVYQPASGTTENRGGESTLGNLVAEVQRWATQLPDRHRVRHRVHEPGRPARRHGGRGQRWRAGPDLPSGRQRPAVRQHVGEHGPHGRSDRDRPRAAMAAHGDRQRPVASVPAAGCVGGLHLHLRRDPGDGERAELRSGQHLPG